MSDDTSIKISKVARERLNALAADRGVTVRDLVETFAEDAFTSTELAARERLARAYLRNRMGVHVDSEALEASARLRARLAGRGGAVSARTA